ncbi:MAG: hypothetical protein WDN31_09505 [Hyphomicrobium sp.]
MVGLLSPARSCSSRSPPSSRKARRPTPVGDPDVPPIGLDLFGTDGPIEIPLPITPAGN